MIIPFLPNYRNDKTEHWLSLLNAALPSHQVKLIEELRSNDLDAAEIAIVANPKSEELRKLPNLKWMHSTWAGVENVIPVARALNIPLVRMKDPDLAKVMSEAVLTWTLFLHRRVPCYQRQQKQKQWLQHALSGNENVTVVILGGGLLGMASADLLSKLGFRVVVWGRSQKTDSPFEYFYGQEQLDVVLNMANVLVVLLPLSSDTRGIIGQKQLQRLPQDASVINFARGPLIDHDALFAELHNEHLYHAVLDVHDIEPLPADSPVWAQERVTVLPHVAAPTNPETASKIIADNIHLYIDTGQIPESVDTTRGY